MKIGDVIVCDGGFSICLLTADGAQIAIPIDKDVVPLARSLLNTTCYLIKDALRPDTRKIQRRRSMEKPATPKRKLSAFNEHISRYCRDAYSSKSDERSHGKIFADAVRSYKKPLQISFGYLNNAAVDQADLQSFVGFGHRCITQSTGKA